MQYSDFQDLASSEKVTLCMLYASSRLMGWTLHSGSIYKIENVDVILDGIEDSGTAYTAAASIVGTTASKYFYDVDTQTLYLRTTGSDNPNGRFIVMRQKLCFANVPIVLPHDLSSGEDVEFLPMLKSTSQFGVSIDVISQASEALEGSGSIVLFNDQDFWPSKYDKLFFENQDCRVYSYNRELDPSDALLIFRGKVEKRSYSATQVSFQLKDQFAEIRSPLALGTIADLSERTASDVATARQRLILGSVQGVRPVNLDEVLEGYPFAGTVSITAGTASLTGVGTSFLKLSPDDQLVLDSVAYTIASISSDTALTLTDNYDNVAGLSGATTTVLPNRPKRWMNREWIVAGHALREPVTAVQNGSSITQLFLDDASDIEVGDMLYVGTLGSGELVRVNSLVGDSQVRLATSLATIPAIGTPIRRPAIQNVRINDVGLVYYQDYTFDATTARLTLRDTAEANSSPIRQMAQSITLTNSSRAVTGSGFKNTIFAGDTLGVVGNADLVEVLSVTDDENLILRAPWTSPTVTAVGRYRSLVLDPKDDVLSVDALGKTVNGLSSGDLLKTVPLAVQALLEDCGLSDNIDTDSFDTANEIAYQKIGLIVPATYGDRNVPTYRDVINQLNKSAFCSLIQNSSFEFGLEVLQPSKPTTAAKFSESDILDLKFTSTAENMIKTAIVTYNPKEYDYLTGKESIATHQKTSDISNYILKTTRTKTFTTFLANSADALIHANRWAYLLENTAGRAVFTTKLQGMRIEIGDIIEVEHRKMFERFGGSDNRRLMFIESVKKSGTTVEIEATDLSASFNRAANITENTDEFADASSDDKLYGGYYTDEYGLIDNGPETSGTNLYW